MKKLQICCVSGWTWIHLHAGFLLTRPTQLVRMDTDGISNSYLTYWKILDFNFKTNNTDTKHKNLTNQGNKSKTHPKKSIYQDKHSMFQFR